MTNTATTVRVTKAQKFEAIINILREADFEPIEIPGIHLKDGSVREGVTMDADYLIEALQNEIEALGRKKTSERKMTPEQEKNKGRQDLIIEFLSTQTEGKSCTDIIREIPEFDPLEVTNQRVAHLLRPFVNDGTVVKNIVKGTPYYSMA